MSQSHSSTDSYYTTLYDNPIGLMDEYAIDQGWSVDRSSESELWTELPGPWGNQRLWVAFHADSRFLQFNTYMNIKIPPQRQVSVAHSLTMINERVWLGHFELWSEEQVPLFRVVLPLSGGRLYKEQLNDIMTSIHKETQRFFPAIQWIVREGKAPEEAIAAAMVETEGEA
ncbi:MAG: YbjN domain-containing protein [Magnetococcales bacterium]|nr:YbjN domain-containing protein [Magnetococcales bacterium]